MHHDDTHQAEPRRRRARRPRASLVVSFLALFVALSGTGYAAITITGRQIKDGTLTGADVRDGSLKSADLAPSARPRAGRTGPAGPQGAAGPQGERGPQGAAGAPGAAGPQGAVGATGPEGPAGARGAACDPAVHGEACRGAQGPQGPQGSPGPQGERGPQGPAGERGPQGLTGPRGSSGAPGERGPQGDAGAAGTNGRLPRAWSAGTGGYERFTGTAYTDVTELTVPAGNYLVTAIAKFQQSYTNVTATCHLFADVVDPQQADVDLGGHATGALETSPLDSFQLRVELTDPAYLSGGNARIWLGCRASANVAVDLAPTLSALELSN